MPARHFDVKHTFTSVTGRAEDVAINTWHFRDPDGTLTDEQVGIGIGNFLDAFWNVGDGVTEPCELLSDMLTGATEIEVYDFQDAKPRAPRYVTGLTVGPIPAAVTFPREVAICLSFEGPKLSGENHARRRGRVYLGPLNVTTGEEAVGDLRPSTQVRNALALAYVTAVDQLTTAGLEHVVFSGRARDNSDPEIPYPQRPLLPASWVPVVKGWIDDAFDTQRSRGLDPTTKTLFAL